MKLKEYLKFNNISNKDFSEKIGISAVSLSRYISGDRLPEKSIINKIHHITDKLVSANDFYIEDGDSQILSKVQKTKVRNQQHVTAT